MVTKTPVIRLRDIIHDNIRSAHAEPEGMHGFTRTARWEVQ
jgi:hypothetical protein